MAPPPNPTEASTTQAQASEAPQTITALEDPDVTMNDDEPLRQYPKGYTHPANIAYNSDDEDEEEWPEDGAGASERRAKQHERRLRAAAARERKAKLAQIPTPVASWYTNEPPSRELDGQATWGEIPSAHAGPSTQHGHNDRCAVSASAAEPAQREIFELREHSTRQGIKIEHYLKDD